MADIEEKNIEQNYSRYKVLTFDKTRCIVSLVVSIIGSLSTFDTKYVDYGIAIVSIYVIFDSFFAKNDFLIHHIIVMGFMLTLLYTTVDPGLVCHLKLHILKTEYSTILYNGEPLITDALYYNNLKQLIPTVNTVCKVGFATLFIRYRIYNYSVNVILFEDLYNYNSYNNTTAYIHYISIFWIFYGLNIYWLQMIILRVLPHKLNK